MTKMQWVPQPCFRSEDDEFMVSKGRLAENYGLFGGPTNAFDLTRTPSRSPRATMSPRRARPERTNWFGRRSNSFSGGGAEIFNAVIVAPQPLAIATATSAPKRE